MSKSMRKNMRGKMVMNYPTTVTVKEGSTADLSLTVLQGDCKNFTGAPFRLLSVRCEALTTDSSRDSGIASSLIQVRLNNALATNVESIASVRGLVSSTQVRHFNLSMPSPNPWKEDEERGQSIISIDNVKLGSALNSVATIYIVARVEYRPLIFTAPASFDVQEHVGSGVVVLK